MIFGFYGVVGFCCSIAFAIYFYYCTFAYDAPLIYPTNYKPLLRWPILAVLSCICLLGSIKFWRGRFTLGSLMSLGSYFLARQVNWAVDDLWT